MTSRTTPVGIVGIALAGIIAMGCSAPTTAVFQALLDPAGTAVSSPEADLAASAAKGGDVATWWPHPEGYEMVLPAGWTGMAVDASQTDELVAAIRVTDAGLGERIDEVLGGSETYVSAIATDGMVAGKIAPALVVLAEPKAGRKKHVIREDVTARISAVPNIDGAPWELDVQLPHAEGVRYEYSIVDPSLGEIRVRSYLFWFAGYAYLVNLVASADLAPGAASEFDQIQDSLKFGA